MNGFTQWYGDEAQVVLWELWSAKWLTVARLAELKVNVLALDTDMMLLADPYPVLRSEALRAYPLVLPPEGSRVNLGFLYVKGASMGARGGVISVLWDVVRRIRLFVEDWTLRNKNGKPYLLGLWDQGVFTDAMSSAQLGAHIYPYSWLQALQSIRPLKMVPHRSSWPAKKAIQRPHPYSWLRALQ